MGCSSRLAEGIFIYVLLFQQINIREVYKKFFMIRDIMKALEEREANMVSYPTMRDFMPKYIEAINAYQEK